MQWPATSRHLSLWDIYRTDKGTVFLNWKDKNNKWKKLEMEYNAEIERLETKKTDYNQQALKIFELTQDIEALYITLPIDKKAEWVGIVSSNSLLDSATLYPTY